MTLILYAFWLLYVCILGHTESKRQREPTIIHKCIQSFDRYTEMLCPDEPNFCHNTTIYHRYISAEFQPCSFFGCFDSSKTSFNQIRAWFRLSILAHICRVILASKLIFVWRTHVWTLSIRTTALHIWVWFYFWKTPGPTCATPLYFCTFLNLLCSFRITFYIHIAYNVF